MEEGEGERTNCRETAEKYSVPSRASTCYVAVRVTFGPKTTDKMILTT